MKKNRSIKFIKGLCLLMFCALCSCAPTKESILRKQEIQRLKAMERNNEVIMKKYNTEGWVTDGTSSIELSLMNHRSKMLTDKYKEYKGTAEQAITKSQAISIAQTIAHGKYAKDIASVINTKSGIGSEFSKKMKDEGVEIKKSFEFEEALKQNSAAVSGGFLEKSYVFVKKKDDNNWSAEVAYVYEKNRDLDALNSVLKKTLQNTKLITKEKLWIKNLMKDLNK